MIRGIILYYLNIKPTHGYEIQQYISMSGMEQWTKIQSGSIYYALTKLEKEKNIAVIREEHTGARVRKIYEITEQGRHTLMSEMRHELETPLFSIGSAKFNIFPILSSLSNEELKTVITSHITELQRTKEHWEKWKNLKAKDDKYGLTTLSFQLTIASIEQQIVWHKNLLEHLDYYVQEAQAMTDMIAKFDFERTKSLEVPSDSKTNIDLLEQLKDTIEKSPETALEHINAIIKQLKNE